MCENNLTLQVACASGVDGKGVSTKKSIKYAVNVFDGEESYEYTYKFSPTQT